MKQAHKTLIFFVLLALAIYYVPLAFKLLPGQIVRFFNSSQMANFIVTINKKAEQALK